MLQPRPLRESYVGTRRQALRQGSGLAETVSVRFDWLTAPSKIEGPNG